MLNKEICKSICKVICFDYYGVDEWTLDDDDYWDNGLVWCPECKRWLSVHVSPPDHCKYFLEQMVMEQDVK